MKNDNNNTCSHEMCDCAVTDNDSDYCSQYCEEADDQDITEIKCGCSHSACS